MKVQDELIDCPVCKGFGFGENDKLCLCCVETSQGFTPGQLPSSVVKRIKAKYPLSKYFNPDPPEKGENDASQRDSN